MEAVEEGLEAFVAGGKTVPRIPVIGAVDIVVAVNVVIFVAVGRTEQGIWRGQDQTVDGRVCGVMQEAGCFTVVDTILSAVVIIVLLTAVVFFVGGRVTTAATEQVSDQPPHQFDRNPSLPPS